MKVSLKWLRDYVDIIVSVRELVEKLTMSGTEVGAIQTIGGQWDSNILVGQLVGIEHHPNADRLRLATVDLGTERTTVVCGAPNLHIGDKVVFAKVGTKLIDGHTGQTVVLKPAKIRGVRSEGMVCSEKELGISDSHEGIMILDPEAPVGTPLSQYLGDTILDLEVTPNRPDCLSMIGIAREVAALTERTLKEPDNSYQEIGEPIEDFISVEIRDPDLCSRYCASLIADIEIKPSPHWMQERLTAAGMRPINNIVDITNYVMLEMGQPLHAFDYEQIRDRKIIVRRAYEGETMITLDGEERTLDRDVLVIADGQGAIALAGVMGGWESEVTEATTSILLESANFDPTSIRRTSNLVRLRSEASTRFDKGLPPEFTIPAIKRATQLMIRLGEGKAAKGIVDVYPGKREVKPIALSAAEVERILGMELTIEQTANVLQRLGFECREAEPGKAISVTIPYWRTDIRLTDDLVEEVARIIGYEAVPVTMLSGRLPEQVIDPARTLRQKVADILACNGLQEIITYSLTSLTQLNKVSLEPLRQEDVPHVANPMTVEQEYLRNSLRPGLLATLAANEKHQEDAIKLFEAGRVFFGQDSELPREKELLVGILTGARLTHSWIKSEGSIDFYDAKGIMENLFEQLGVSVDFTPGEDYILLPGRTAKIAARHGESVDKSRLWRPWETNGTEIGVLGELKPNIAEAFDISSRPVYLFEIDMEKLLSLTGKVPSYQPLPRLPGVNRDIAVIVDRQVEAKKVQDIIQASPMVKEVALFDVYTGRQIPSGKKSLAFSILYQSAERTLTDEEVDRAQAQIMERLHMELGATLRGS